MSDTNPPRRFDNAKVVRRKEEFVKKTATRIWDETPTRENPYVAESARCHGYDLLDLMAKRSFSDVLFLLFSGDLPTADESQLLETLAIGLINPGPRHSATRAAMNAGVGKTDPSLILPVGLTILGGEHLGAAEVEPAIRWLRKNAKKDPVDTANQLIQSMSPQGQGDTHIVPGFGSRYGGADRLTIRVAEQMLTLPGAGDIMKWADQFSRTLETRSMGWLATGLAAAVFSDLGFQPRMGAGLFQIISAPGLFAHGIEMASKPLTAMPFPDDSDYFIDAVRK